MTVTDHLGRAVSLPAGGIQRAVSLCPSQTETLYALGLGDRVVGRTNWCIHPAGEIENAEAVGGTKKVNLNRVRALAPDFFLCEKEENTPEMVAALEAIAPVFVTDIHSVADALRMIQDIGALFDCPAVANNLAEQIDSAFAAIPGCTKPISAAYFIWRAPWMVAGQDTYIQDILARLGLHNVALQLSGRYPEITLHAIAALAPEVVLLSSEPYTFTQEHALELLQHLPATKVLLVDGEAFSWYGARMLPAARYLTTLVRQLSE
jgi:iron complex transport system substrate-binding protein